MGPDYETDTDKELRLYREEAHRQGAVAAVREALEREGVTLVLLGAEEVAELEGQPWLSVQNSPEARAVFREQNHLSERDCSALAVDGTGRPYFLVGISRDAPASVQEKARTCVRVRRFD